MLIKYSWLAGQSAANILADVIGLITNSITDPANCSVACDKANSAIIANSLVSNWVVHDSTYGVLRSQNVNGTYKYAQILTGAKLSLKAWENWNSSTHVGLNQAGGSSTSHPASALSNPSGQTSLSTAGTIYIYATSRNLYVDGAFIGEFASLTQAIGDGYPRHFILNMISTTNMVGNATMTGENTPGISRIKNKAAAGDLLNTSIQVLPATKLGPYGAGYIRTPDEVILALAQPVLVTTQVGPTGKLYDLIHLTNGLGASLLDEVQVDGITYFKIGKYSVSALPEVHHVFAVKG